MYARHVFLQEAFVNCSIEGIYRIYIFIIHPFSDGTTISEERICGLLIKL